MLRRAVHRVLPTLWVAVLLVLLSACTTFEPQPVDLLQAPGDIQSETKHDISVSTTILSDEQASRLYGVDLGSVGLQAVWLRIENRTEHAHWLLVSALDANYYPPDEAAALFHPILSAKDEQAATNHFRSLAIPLKITPGSVKEGYVLVPRTEGGRYVVVKLVGTQHVVDFGFAVTLPDGDFDFERLDPAQIYADQERPDLGLEQLRAELRRLPCCATDSSGEREGDPLNLVVIGNVDDVLAAMSRAGWSFTHRIGASTIRRMIGAAMSGAAYPVAPVSPLYFQGRPQDMALQRARSTIVQRNHLRLWLAPFRFEQKSVWVGQISRDIAIKATTQTTTLTTHVIDPNVDEAREHLLQSLLVSGAIERYGFVRGMEPVSAATPRANLTGDPYFTDGLRFVVMLSGGSTTAPENAEYLEWVSSGDPVRLMKETAEP